MAYPIQGGRDVDIAHVIIDGSHVAMTVRQLRGMRNDDPIRFSFERLHEAVLNNGGKRRTIGKHSAIIHSKPPLGRRPFVSDADIAWLIEHGYEDITWELRSREIECFDCGRRWYAHREKSVDAEIVTRMAYAGVEMDVKRELVVLISGDGDFVKMVKLLERHGVRVEVWGFSNHTSAMYLERRNFGGRLEDFLD